MANAMFAPAQVGVGVGVGVLIITETREYGKFWI